MSGDAGAAALLVQRKPTISSPGDPHEREADEVAEKVMHMAEPSGVDSAPAAIQRKCAACENEERTIEAMRAPDGSASAAPDVGGALRAAEHAGSPLSAGIRSHFEPRFGQDFSAVRVHADSDAANAARAISARAFTVGEHVIFGQNQYAPETDAGRRLLAHELAHVVQQRSGAVRGEEAIQRKPIKDLALSHKLASVTLKQLSKPQVARQDHKGSDTIDLLMTRPLDVEATAQFASGADAAGLTFGFFQLGRPYELYRATMHKIGADRSSSDDDLNLDLTMLLRSNLPTLDHSAGARFFASPRGSQTAVADANGKVTLKYSDLLSTPFAKDIQKGGTYYGLSGIAAQSFLFTAFGAWDGTNAIILATFYWDMKHCEVIPPGDVTSTKTFGAINVAPFRSCKTGGCDLNEPGADQFGQPAKNSFVSWVGKTLLDAVLNPGAYAGPSTFALGCQSRQGKGAKRGQ